MTAVVGELGTFDKGLYKDWRNWRLEELEISRRIGRIQTIAFLRLAKIPRRFQLTSVDLLRLRLQ